MLSLAVVLLVVIAEMIVMVEQAEVVWIMADHTVIDLVSDISTFEMGQISRLSRVCPVIEVMGSYLIALLGVEAVAWALGPASAMR